MRGIIVCLILRSAASEDIFRTVGQTSDAVVPPEPAGKCCYSSATDCDSERDWCSKNVDRCTSCGGTLQGSSPAAPAPAPAQPPAAAVLLATVAGKASPDQDQQEASQTAGHCCYSSATDCDSAGDSCSKGESQCTECGGKFYKKTAAQALPPAPAPVPDAQLVQSPILLEADVGKASPTILVAADNTNGQESKCCYSSATDCDSPRDWCSKSELQCTSCGGKLYNKTDEKVDAKKEDVAAPPAPAPLLAVPASAAANPPAPADSTWPFSLQLAQTAKARLTKASRSLASDPFFLLVTCFSIGTFVSAALVWARRPRDVSLEAPLLLVA